MFPTVHNYRQVPSDFRLMMFSAELQWPSVWAQSIEYVLEDKDIPWDVDTREISG